VDRGGRPGTREDRCGTHEGPTWTVEDALGPEGTAEDALGPEGDLCGTHEDQRGPRRTPWDPRGPGPMGTYGDLRGPRRTL